MIKRTVEISRQAVHLSVRQGQLRLLGRDDPRTPIASIPCEDIGLLIVDEWGTTYTHAAVAELLEHDAAFIVCGKNHLPAGLLLPLADHTQVVWRVHDQIAVKKPLRKRLWQQIVRAKVRAQAGNLPEGTLARGKLLALVGEVRSGDPTNVEAQAAKLYWSALFEPQAFRRNPDGDGINAMLNYGYAIVRASVARAIVAAGLMPALGIHHSNRANAFCLADDLVEPLRPIVDGRVRALVESGCTDINPDSKRGLLELLTVEVRTADQTGPLMVALHRYAASLVRCFEGKAERLQIPSVVDGA